FHNGTSGVVGVEAVAKGPRGSTSMEKNLEKSYYMVLNGTTFAVLLFCCAF
ncbi:hypothetical protein ACJX0J_007525, partial [Zea mays]